MNKIIRAYHLLLFITFLFFNGKIFSQQPLVKTTVDKNNILIGEPIKYKVVASFDKLHKLNWLTIPDSIAHFEVVEKSKIDTATENNNTVLQQTITLTSFDSGKWNVPSFLLKLDDEKKNKATKIFTDTIVINVGYAAADSTNQLRDIKPIMEVTVKDYLWYYIGGAAVLFLLFSFILWRYFKNRKKKPSPVFASKLSPYDEAMQLLAKLKKTDLQNPKEVKAYHSALAEIFKKYVGRRQSVDMMNKTTGGILVHLTDSNLPKEKLANMATALRCGDAVKFAKFVPDTNESEGCFNNIKETIQFLNTNKLIK